MTHPRVVLPPQTCRAELDLVPHALHFIEQIGLVRVLGEERRHLLGPLQVAGAEQSFGSHAVQIPAPQPPLSSATPDTFPHFTSICAFVSGTRQRLGTTQEATARLTSAMQQPDEGFPEDASFQSFKNGGCWPTDQPDPSSAP